MTDNNPYQVPEAELVAPEDNEFALANPQKRPVGEGWRWISDAFGLLFGGYWVWLLMGIVFFFIMLALQFVPLVGGFAATVLWPVFSGGVMWACLELERNGKVQFEHLFAGFSNQSSSLLVVGAIYLALTIVLMIVSFVVLTVMLGISGGFTLFEAMFTGDLDAIDPGTAGSAISVAILLFVLVNLALALPLYMAIWFAPALVIFHGVKPFEAMKRSFMGCLKNIVPFLWYGIIGLGLCIVAAIPLGLGFFIVMPMFVLSQYTSYKSVFVRK